METKKIIWKSPEEMDSLLVQEGESGMRDAISFTTNFPCKDNSTEISIALRNGGVPIFDFWAHRAVLCKPGSYIIRMRDPYGERYFFVNVSVDDYSKLFTEI